MYIIFLLNQSIHFLLFKYVPLKNDINTIIIQHFYFLIYEYCIEQTRTNYESYKKLYLCTYTTNLYKTISNYIHITPSPIQQLFTTLIKTMIE